MFLGFIVGIICLTRPQHNDIVVLWRYLRLNRTGICLLEFTGQNGTNLLSDSA